MFSPNGRKTDNHYIYGVHTIYTENKIQNIYLLFLYTLQNPQPFGIISISSFIKFFKTKYLVKHLECSN